MHTHAHVSTRMSMQVHAYVCNYSRAPCIKQVNDLKKKIAKKIKVCAKTCIFQNSSKAEEKIKELISVNRQLSQRKFQSDHHNNNNKIR